MSSSEESSDSSKDSSSEEEEDEKSKDSSSEEEEDENSCSFRHISGDESEIRNGPPQNPRHSATAAIKLPVPFCVDFLSWQPEGEVVACGGGAYPCVIILNLEKLGTEAMKLESGNGLKCMEWSASGNMIATWSGEKGALVWDSKGVLVSKLLTPRSNMLMDGIEFDESENRVGIEFNESENLVVAVRFEEYEEQSDGCFAVFEVDNGTCLQEVNSEYRGLDQIVWKGDRELITSCYNPEGHTSIQLWRVGQDTHIMMTMGMTPIAWDARNGVLAFMNIGKNSIMTMNDEKNDSIQLWNPDSTDQSVTFLNDHSTVTDEDSDADVDIDEEDRVEGLLWNPDGSGILASWTQDGEIKIWNTVTRTCLCTVQTRARDPYIISFSPDFLLFAFEDEYEYKYKYKYGYHQNKVHVCKTDTGELTAVYEVVEGVEGVEEVVEGDRIRDIVWSPRGDQLVVATEPWREAENGKLFIFNLNSMMSLKTLAILRVASCLKKQLESGQDQDQEKEMKEKMIGLLDLPPTVQQEVGFYL